MESKQTRRPRALVPSVCKFVPIARISSLLLLLLSTFNNIPPWQPPRSAKTSMTSSSHHAEVFQKLWLTINHSARLNFHQGMTYEQEQDIHVFLHSAPDYSLAKQFGQGGFPISQCPPGTVYTEAFVKKYWHGPKQRQWITVELNFLDAQE